MMGMPLLVINMGGEMIYILEQRLRAQSIPAEKSEKVLVDVVRTMYSKNFISELFNPKVRPHAACRRERKTCGVPYIMHCSRVPCCYAHTASPSAHTTHTTHTPSTCPSNALPRIVTPV